MSSCGLGSAFDFTDEEDDDLELSTDHTYVKSDAVVYREHVERHFAEFSPATKKEGSLVQCIADCEWRLLQIVPLEAGIYAIGRRKLADEFADEPDSTARRALIDAQIFMTYRKEFSSLASQERRLRSQRKADTAELQRLQNQRLNVRDKGGQEGHTVRNTIEQNTFVRGMGTFADAAQTVERGNA